MSNGSISEWLKKCYDNSGAHGWWEGVPSPLPAYIIGSKLMLAISELSEALELVREPDFDPHAVWGVNETAARVPYDIVLEQHKSGGKLLKPEGFPIEIADVVIRIFDLSGRLELDLERDVHRYRAHLWRLSAESQRSKAPPSVTLQGWTSRFHQAFVEAGEWKGHEVGPLDPEFALSRMLEISAELARAHEQAKKESFVTLARTGGDYDRLLDFNYVLENMGAETPCPEPFGFTASMAKALARTFDLCGRFGVELEAAVELKHVYNVSRPARHGGKRA